MPKLKCNVSVKNIIGFIVSVYILFEYLQLPIIAQQDGQYSMYLFNQFIINPAYAGAREAIATVGSIRNQWVSFPGAPQTAYISVHAPLKKYHLGYGIIALNEKLGAKNNSSAYATLSYILNISTKWKLSFGIRAGASNYKFDLSKTTYKDVNDNSFFVLNNYNKTVLDIDAGLYLRSRSFYAGMSLTHLNQAKVINGSFDINTTSSDVVYTLVLHAFYIIGKSFTINKNFLINANILFKVTKGSGCGDISINTLLYNRVWLGIFARSDYGGGLLFQIIATKSLRLGYAYEIGNNIKRALGPSHELMIGWDIKPKNNTTIINPRFL